MSHSIRENIKQIQSEIGNTKLVVVSKYRTISELQEVYDTGHRHFGENRVQELTEKYDVLPKDIKWHVIGHLQRNKVKYIVPFVHLIHSVDSMKLLAEVDKQAEKENRIVDFLLQVHIADESTKFGFEPEEISELLQDDGYTNLKNVSCKGLMGMATNTKDTNQVAAEFNLLNTLFAEHRAKENWDTLSMGMSGDYVTAIECGSTLIRVGSKIFSA